jgi:ubiquinone/menaquinone biosynthesis C-methylase UbiE
MMTSEEPHEIVARGYDVVAEDYANLEGAVEWPRMRWLRKVLAELSPGSRALDLGGGSGIPATTELAREHDVVGVDVSARQIELARRVEMFFSCFDADTTRRLIREAGFEILADPIETQLEVIGKFHTCVMGRATR